MFELSSVGSGMFGNNAATNWRSSERPSSAGLIALFVVQACLSAVAVVSALFGSMAVASCGPMPSTSCNMGLATAAGFLPFVVGIVSFVGALVWASRSRNAGHRGIWGPLAGSLVVVLGIGVNLLMNAVAIPGLFGNPY